MGQTLEFLKDFCYKPNQPGPNNSQIIAFLESKILNNKLNTPKGCSEIESLWVYPISGKSQIGNSLQKGPIQIGPVQIRNSLQTVI